MELHADLLRKLVVHFSGTSATKRRYIRLTDIGLVTKINGHKMHIALW